MSRQLLCASCGHGKAAGVRTFFERSDLGEPAEYGRVVWGVARRPDTSQRVMTVNGAPIQLPGDVYDCDGCGCAIRPGERACAQSIWTERQTPVPAWERAYLMETLP